MLEYCLTKISSLVSTCAVFQLEECCKTRTTSYFIFKGNIHNTVNKVKILTPILQNSIYQYGLCCWNDGKKIHNKTRMHSSKMHTARSLTVSRSIREGLPNQPPTLDADPLLPWMQTPSGCRPPSGCRTPWSCDQWYMLWSQPPGPCGQKEWHTLLKTLPSRNYCCGR